MFVNKSTTTCENTQLGHTVRRSSRTGPKTKPATTSPVDTLELGLFLEGDDTELSDTKELSDGKELLDERELSDRDGLSEGEMTFEEDVASDGIEDSEEEKESLTDRVGLGFSEAISPSRDMEGVELLVSLGIGSGDVEPEEEREGEMLAVMEEV